MEQDYTLDELFGMLRESLPHRTCRDYEVSDWCKSHGTCSECRDALIDAIERKARDEYAHGYRGSFDDGYASADDWMVEHAEDMERHGWHRALDGDGKPVRLGDMMEGVDKYDSLRVVAGRVTAIIFDDAIDPAESTTVAIRVWDVAGKYSHTAYLDPNASVYRHHRPPTVEDVLREFGDWYAHTKGGCDEDGVIADFAKRLRLAEKED